MIDVKAMREIVKAATPGEWMLGDENNSSAEVMLGAKHNLVVCLDRYDKNTGEQVISREQMLANARHIITFNPESVTALLDAIEAAQAKVKEFEARQRWVPVSERLPERLLLPNGDDAGVLAYQKDYCECGFDYTVSNREYFRNQRCKFTHWMPLPQPPEQESELRAAIPKEKEL